jgi:hypothetical protein
MGTPKVITSPGDLDLPEKMDEVFTALSDKGKGEYITEFNAALVEAKETNNFYPVQHVVNAWWVSSLFLTHEGIDKALDAAANPPDDAPQLTAQEIGELLGVG